MSCHDLVAEAEYLEVDPRIKLMNECLMDLESTAHRGLKRAQGVGVSPVHKLIGSY